VLCQLHSSALSWQNYGRRKRYMVILCKIVLQPAHALNYFINVLNEVSEGRLTNCRLWSARSPDLNPRDSDLLGNWKDEVYSNSLCTFAEVKHDVFETVTSTEVSELKLVSNNLFKRGEVCLRAEGIHF
jgi:hypothetical protein